MSAPTSSLAMAEMASMVLWQAEARDEGQREWKCPRRTGLPTAA